MRWSVFLVSMGLAMVACGDLGAISAQSPTTSTTAYDAAASSDVGLEPLPPPLVDPVYCENGAATPIEAADLEAISTWDVAPTAVSDALSEYTERPISELGTWRIWPGGTFAEPAYVLETPISTEPLLPTRLPATAVTCGLEARRR
ncbi:MAG: hypothetical protein R2706_06460 [Acidimicrobiales bacterium]